MHTPVKPIETSAETPTTKKRRTSDSGHAEVTKKFDSSSETDSKGDQVKKNVSLITHTIGGTVSQLCLLSDAVRRSAKIARADTVAGYTSDEKTNNAVQELRIDTEKKIRPQFPNATEALRTALIEANALRLRRLCYQRAHRPVALSLQRPPNTMTEVPRAEFVAEDIPAAPKTSECPYCGVTLEFDAMSPEQWRQVPLSHSSPQETKAHLPQQSPPSRFRALRLRY